MMRMALQSKHLIVLMKCTFSFDVTLDITLWTDCGGALVLVVRGDVMFVVHCGSASGAVAMSKLVAWKGICKVV